jgi:hypothetical protein
LQLVFLFPGHFFFLTGLTKAEQAAKLKQQAMTVSRPWMDESLAPATAPEDLDFSSPSQACSVEWV